MSESWHPADVAQAFEDEVRGFVSDFIEEGFKALFEPFTSSSSSCGPEPDHHMHCYPCRDEDCDRR